MTLTNILECQKILNSGYFGKRGNIADDFHPKTDNDYSETTLSSRNKYIFWISLRNKETSKPNFVPSYVATNSLLSSKVKYLTRYAFTPIIPHPATCHDTIFTCMVNFQDVLKQKGTTQGALWCDEGVYSLAKELQLLNQKRFENIFLGLGGFHMEKIIISCLGR